MGSSTRIVFYIITLVLLFVVVVILFGQSGAWEDLKEAVLGTIEFSEKVLPTVKVGLEEQKADVSIPDVHQKEIEKLRAAMQGMLGKGKENCFANYGKLPDLGEQGTSLTLELKDDKTTLTVRGGAGGKQIITGLYQEFSGMKPCVIAGTFGESKNFFDYFINGKEKLIHPYYRAVNSVTIFYSTQGFNGNRISAADANVVNKLEDDGWLFTPDGQNVCFFPTNDVSDFDDGGIDNDYFTEEQENSIPQRITEGKLKLCT